MKMSFKQRETLAKFKADGGYITTRDFQIALFPDNRLWGVGLVHGDEFAERHRNAEPAAKRIAERLGIPYVHENAWSDEVLARQERGDSRPVSMAEIAAKAREEQDNRAINLFKDVLEALAK